MTEPRGIVSLHLLSRRRRRRVSSTSLEEPLLLGNDEEGGGSLLERAEQQSFSFQRESRFPSRTPQRQACQGRHHHIHHCRRHQQRFETTRIHPALEYEILSSSDLLVDEIDHSTSHHRNSNNFIINADCLLQQSQQRHHEEEEEEKEDCSCSTSHSKSNSIKLFFSFIFLILFGSANTVALKLQAVPMYVQYSSVQTVTLRMKSYNAH
jgi:hypothetical protein